MVQQTFIPFSPPIIKNRLFYTKPDYGDLVVFKTPSDNRTDFIKRLIGSRRPNSI